MKLVMLVMSIFLLASCATEEGSETDDGSEGREGNSLSSSDARREVGKIDKITFDRDHEEEAYSQKEDSVDLEAIQFNVRAERTEVTELVLEITVEEGEELRIGSTHFRLEEFTAGEWEQIEGVLYGAEDAETIITAEEPFEKRFSDLDQYDADFDTGVYRIVNSGYVFPFYIYLLR
ncbi:hypothetical protein IRB23SM22_20270 [Alkalibacterium sp. s-m-22]